MASLWEAFFDFWITLTFIIAAYFALKLLNRIAGFRIAKAWLMFASASFLWAVQNILKFLKSLYIEGDIPIELALPLQMMEMMSAFTLMLAVWFLVSSFVFEEEASS